MVNAGAIMTTSLIRPEEDIADRFDLVGCAAAGPDHDGKMA
jgi:glutaminase